MDMINIIIHRIIRNFRENKLSEKCAIITAIYANWGHGIHGKMDPIIAIIHSIIHIIHHNIDMVFFYIKRDGLFTVCLY